MRARKRGQAPPIAGLGTQYQPGIAMQAVYYNGAVSPAVGGGFAGYPTSTAPGVYPAAPPGVYPQPVSGYPGAPTYAAGPVYGAGGQPWVGYPGGTQKQ